jgi:hypothetical protein
MMRPVYFMLLASDNLTLEVRISALKDDDDDDDYDYD